MDLVNVLWGWIPGSGKEALTLFVTRERAADSDHHFFEGTWKHFVRFSGAEECEGELSFVNKCVEMRRDEDSRGLGWGLKNSKSEDHSPIDQVNEIQELRNGGGRS